MGLEEWIRKSLRDDPFVMLKRERLEYVSGGGILLEEIAKDDLLNAEG